MFVRSPMGMTIGLYVQPFDTIASVKMQISYETGTPADQLDLVFHGNYLHDTCTLEYYELTEESELLYKVKDQRVIGKRKHRAGLGRRRHRRRRVHYVTSESTVDHGYDAEDEDMLPSETRTPSPATISDAEQRAPGSGRTYFKTCEWPNQRWRFELFTPPTADYPIVLVGLIITT